MFLSELVLGRGVTKAIGIISLRALDRGAVEGYREAIDMLRGISMLLRCCGLADVGTTIALGNDMQRLMELQRRAERVDHVIPRAQGGSDKPENLVAACAPCNLSKGGRTPKQAGMELTHG